MIMTDSKYVHPCSGHDFICPIFGGSKDEGCCCKFYRCFCQIVHLISNVNLIVEDSNYTFLLNFITIFFMSKIKYFVLYNLNPRHRRSAYVIRG